MNQSVVIPAYEDRAREGIRSPHRFRWRGQWFQVKDVLAFWRDGRKPQPDHLEFGRHYYNVLTDGGQVFQLYFDAARPAGRWVLYRVTRFMRRGD